MTTEKNGRYKLWIEVVKLICAAIVGILTTLAATGCSSMGDVQWNGRLLRHPETPYKSDPNAAPNAAVVIPHKTEPRPNVDVSK